MAGKPRQPAWPWLLRTPRLVMRCWRESDALPLTRVIRANHDHLSAWMPWAGDPAQQTADSKLEFICKSRRQFARGKTLNFALFDAEERSILGAAGIHARIGSGAREIGYWIAKDHARQGLATEAAGALVRVGFEILRLRRIEIHCDPKNEPSAGVARRLGFALQTTIRQCVPRPNIAPRDNMVWAMRRADFNGSPAHGIQIEAFTESGDQFP